VSIEPEAPGKRRDSLNKLQLQLCRKLFLTVGEGTR